MPQPESEISRDKLLTEIQAIKNELNLLNNHQLVRMYSALSSLLFFMFLKGVAFGLGSVVGATIVVSLIAYILAQVELIPIVGEWVSALLAVIRELETQ